MKIKNLKSQLSVVSCQLFSRGFTLIEVLIYSTVFVIAGGVMLGVLTVVVKFESQQNASVELTNQMELVLQQVKRLVSQSQTVSISPDHKTVTLTMADASINTIVLQSSDGTVTLNGAALTTSKVAVDVSGSSFMGHVDARGAIDAVSIVLKMSAKVPGGADAVRTIQTTIARGI